MDLFYTAAMDNTAKLWDLRTMKECRCFEGAHAHSSQRLQCRLSPCLRYLCMPSEDGSVCVYDVRMGKVLDSRHHHRDTVCAVDIHPRSGCMASGGFDGKVRFYRPPASETSSKGRGRGPGGNLTESKQSRSREVRMRQVSMSM